MSVERRLPDARGAHEHHGLTRPKPLPHSVEAEPVEAARDQHWGAYRYLLDLGFAYVECFHEISFVEQHCGSGATFPDSRQVALEPSRVEIAVEPHDDEDRVDIGCDDLLDRPPTRDLA